MWIWLVTHKEEIDAFVHLGAKSGYFQEGWMLETKQFMAGGQRIWQFCTENSIPLIYASSGAVYESGEHGFKDDKTTSFNLNPKHPYTKMRLEFDNWVLKQDVQPPFWAGLRMFNVYGPNEYHKQQNASMIYKAYNEILSYGSLRLFQSYRIHYENGEMKRDFVYVKDVVRVISFMIKQQPESGIYNIGTGQAASFNDMANKVFEVLGMAPSIQYEPIPESLRDDFPYYSCADITRLRKAGYNEPFMSLEKGVEDYINKYLSKGEFY
jgi:ADP-L-glycero-D-manno-heptose 6-epimerase